MQIRVVQLGARQVLVFNLNSGHSSQRTRYDHRVGRVRRQTIRCRLAWAALGIGCFVILLGLHPSTRNWTFRHLGRWIVIQDPLEHADVALVTMEAGRAGLLEAADLVREGVVSRIAIFRYQLTVAELEMRNRGVDFEDATQRASHQLQAMRVRDVHEITAASGGTQEEGVVLPEWCTRSQIGTAIVVTSRDRSRRVGRVLRRAMNGRGTRLVVRSARHSQYDPDHWWLTRDGRRVWIVEAQKLILDILWHPALG